MARRRRRRDQEDRQRERLREGYLGVPRDWIERVRLGQLQVEQLGILVCAAADANYEAEPKLTPIYKTGEQVLLGRGQALVGARSFAERHHMGAGGRDRVKRCLARGSELGICTVGPAGGAPPPAPGGAPPGTPPDGASGAPPPTLTEFKRDSEILFPTKKAAPPPLVAVAPPRTPPPAPPPAPIQQETFGHETTATGTTTATRGVVHEEEAHTPRALPLPQELKAVKKALEKELGIRLLVPGKDREEDRRFVIDEFSDWIAQEPQGRVVAACLRVAEKAARKGQSTFSMLYFAQARERASDDFEPRGKAPSPGSSQTRGSRWASLLERMNIDQRARWHRENQAMHAPGNESADWDEFFNKWDRALPQLRARAAPF